MFVAVHHGDTVNLYLSDETGQYYVLSLADVFHDEKPDWFEIDFAEVCEEKKKVSYIILDMSC